MTECEHGETDPSVCPPCQGAARPVVHGGLLRPAYRFRPVEARYYRGSCPAGCGDPIDVGDLIGPAVEVDTDDTVWVHEHCLPPQDGGAA